MELNITKYTPLNPIRIENLSELKKELTMKVAHYAGLVITEDQTKEMKKELADLRKFTKAISDERIRVKKDLQAAMIDPFEQDVKEIVSIVQEPIDLIDGQLKAFEEQKKEEKRQKILEIIEAEEIPTWVDIDRIWDPRWLNASYNIKAVGDDIAQKKRKIIDDMKTLDTLPEFSWEAMEAYKQTLDLNYAIGEGKRLLDIQKRKEEAERIRKEQEAQKAAEAVQKAQEAVEPAKTDLYAPEQEEASWVPFDAYLTPSQAQLLGAFMKQHGIKYRKHREEF